jgi:hypothetical protein
MKTMTRIGLGIVCLAICQPASAALLIEGRSTNGDDVQVYKSYIDGQNSRMGGADARQYVLMNWKTKSFFIVDTISKQATDMSISLKQGVTSQQCPQPEVDAVLERIDTGPTLAGYPTEHYIVKADGKACEELFTSREAMEAVGEWFNNLRDMQERDDDDLGRSKCDIASDKVVDLGKIGWPLKTVTLRGGGKGHIDEILRIKANASVPVGFFSVPAGYRIIKAEELYPGMTGSGASGSAMQLPCPSLDEYDDLDDDNEYAEADQMEEYTEGLGGTDDGDEDPNLAEEISGAAIDDAEQTAAEEMGEQVKDSVSKGLKKIFGN